MPISEIEMAEAPKITLAKKAWAIPELAVRQIQRIIPAMSRAHRIDSENISEEDIRTLFDIAFIALGRAYPELKRDEFDDLPIRLPEIMSALPVIAKQSGMEVTAQPVGEALAETLKA